MTGQLLMFVNGKNHVPIFGYFFDTHDPSNGAVLASVAKG
jgi:hypothetical protein